MPVLFRLMIPETVSVQFLQKQMLKLSLVLTNFLANITARNCSLQNNKCSTDFNLCYKKDLQFHFVTVYYMTEIINVFVLQGGKKHSMSRDSNLVEALNFVQVSFSNCLN